MYSFYKTNSIFKTDFLQSKISVACFKIKGEQLKETLSTIYNFFIPSMAPVTGKHE